VRFLFIFCFVYNLPELLFFMKHTEKGVGEDFVKIFVSFMFTMTRHFFFPEVLVMFVKYTVNSICSGKV
jgi:hypothetical protein